MISLTWRPVVLRESGTCFMVSGLAQPGSGEGPVVLKVSLTCCSLNNYNLQFSEDVVAEGKYDVSEIFNGIALNYFNITDEITKSGLTGFLPEDMAEMMIDTRPTYPSSKLTFSIANITKHKEIRFFNIYIDLNWVYDVNLIFEDSKRNSLKPFIF